MTLLDSLLDAIIRLKGESLVMHVGERPYVVTSSSALDSFRGPLSWGQVELSSRPLTPEAVLSMLGQMLPSELRKALDENGALEHEFDAPDGGQPFVVVAARGGDDVWVELRRKPEPVPEAPPVQVPAEPAASVAPLPADVPAVSAPPMEPAQGPIPMAEAVAAPAGESPSPIVEAPRLAAVDYPAALVAAGQSTAETVLGFDEAAEIVEIESDEEAEEWFSISVPNRPEVPAPVPEAVTQPDVPEEPGVEISLVLDEPEPGVVVEEPQPVALDEPVLVEMLQPVAVEEPEPVVLAVEEAQPVALDEPVLVEMLQPVAVEEPEPVVLAVEEAQPVALDEPVLVEMLQPVAVEEPEPVVLAVAEAQPVALDEPVLVEMLQPVAVEEPEPVVLAVAEAQPVALDEPVLVEMLQPVAVEEPEPVVLAVEEAQPVALDEPVLVEMLQPVAVEEPEPVVLAVAEAQPVALEQPVPVATRPVRVAEPVPVVTVAQPQPAASAVGQADPEAARPVVRLQPKDAPLSHAVTAAVVDVLRHALERGASTVYAIGGSRPLMRVEGEISTSASLPLLQAGDLDRFAFEFAPRDEVLAATSEWVTSVPGIGRLRCVSFEDEMGRGLVLHLAANISTADELGLSREIQALCQEADGLIVVSGPRTSGKSSLLHAFIDRINRSRADHVITIESHVQTLHERRHSLISQREVDGDGEAVARAARAALREGPDVLVVDDIRSPEAIAVALDAARAGRLVFASLPAPDATAAIERLTDAFAVDRRPQIRALLSGALRGVIAQVLVRKATGGRTAAREVLLRSPAVAKLILDGATAQMPIAIQSGRRLGMRTMLDSLVALVRDGVVEPAEAARHAPDRTMFVAALQQEGIDVSDLERRA